LCNNLVDHTSIKFIGNHSNCQMSMLTNESPHIVGVCACCQIAVQFPPFLTHLQSLCARDRESLPNDF
jgi:hypothetical protein